ncbi:MAG: hypothetical protein QM533_10750 [Cytophagales bacterium]|nr:hypothetical protein [Cytophagales bacterium]
MVATYSTLPQGLAILDNSMVLAMLMPAEVDATAALLLNCGNNLN